MEGLESCRAPWSRGPAPDGVASSLPCLPAGARSAGDGERSPRWNRGRADGRRRRRGGPPHRGFMPPRPPVPTGVGGWLWGRARPPLTIRGKFLTDHRAPQEEPRREPRAGGPRAASDEEEEEEEEKKEEAEEGGGGAVAAPIPTSAATVRTRPPWPRRPRTPSPAPASARRLLCCPSRPPRAGARGARSTSRNSGESGGPVLGLVLPSVIRRARGVATPPGQPVGPPLVGRSA